MNKRAKLADPKLRAYFLQRVKSLHADGFTDRELTESTGLSLTAVVGLRRELGLAANAYGLPYRGRK